MLWQAPVWRVWGPVVYLALLQLQHHNNNDSNNNSTHKIYNADSNEVFSLNSFQTLFTSIITPWISKFIATLKQTNKHTNSWFFKAWRALNGIIDKKFRGSISTNNQSTDRYILWDSRKCLNTICTYPFETLLVSSLVEIKLDSIRSTCHRSLPLVKLEEVCK